MIRFIYLWGFLLVACCFLTASCNNDDDEYIDHPTRMWY